jgi:hypothetical protein
MLNHGVRLETVSRLLGHAATTITEQAYAQLTDQRIRTEVENALSIGAGKPEVSKKMPAVLTHATKPTLDRTLTFHGGSSTTGLHALGSASAAGRGSATHDDE